MEYIQHTIHLGGAVKTPLDALNMAFLTRFLHKKSCSPFQPRSSE